MKRARVLITCPQLQRTIEQHRARLEGNGIEILLPRVVQQLSEEELMDLMPGSDGMIAGDDPLTSQVLARADRLRVISKWGVGIDNIDLGAAARMGIRVTNTPGMFGDEVADVVIGYLILLARQLHRVDALAKSGEWPKIEGVSLAGRTLGIVGLGAIGRAVAKRAVAMGMNIVGTDIDEANAAAGAALGVRPASLTELLPQVDVLSLNCPLTEDNRHMMNAGTLGTMRGGAWIINTARGPLIDEAALVDALASGAVGAAALDVFEVEPLPAESPLRRFDNVILGSHNSSNTAEAVRRTSLRAIQNLVDGLAEVSR
jgi:phosphoglycerate dehydrogenase-like enzyme